MKIYALMMVLIALGALTLLEGCTNLPEGSGSSTSNPTKPIIQKPEESLGKKTEVWGTIYYLNKTTYQKDENGIPLRTPKGDIITYLSEGNWCRCAMEGSCKIENGTTVVVGYHSKGSTRQANCRYRPSSYATFFIDKNRYGTGNKNNPLVPHVSVACDQRFYSFGQWFFIPRFKGVRLPDGRVHDGMFRCDDVGGMIKGNHLDFFVGEVDRWQDHPFLKLADSKTRLEAYLVEGNP